MTHCWDACCGEAWWERNLSHGPKAGYDAKSVELQWMAK